jgi:hypothetical protein
MSLTHTYNGVSVAERDSRRNDRGENTAPPADSTETTRRFGNELPVAGEPVAVDEFVARVLGQAHQAAHAHAAPDEARVILDLALLFAGELAKTNVRFDRLRFIHAATEEPSHA